MREERDLRKYARTTNRRLVIGVILLLFIVGDGLIFLLYGGEAGGLALICTLIGLAPLLLIVLGLQLMDWASRKLRDE
ncbi:MAG: hypothetical protein GTO18_09700 [Anaerolineales bacterium]|nr:hypothetical protein [Anaerolineales bacterium]